MQHCLALCHLDMQYEKIEIIYQTIWERRMLIVMGKSFIGLRLTSLDSIRRADTDVHE